MAVGREGQAIDWLRVSSQYAQLAAAGEVPEVPPLEAAQVRFALGRTVGLKNLAGKAEIGIFQRGLSFPIKVKTVSCISR